MTNEPGSDEAFELTRRVQRLLGSEAMKPVIDKLDRRLGRRDDLEGMISLKNPSAETLEAVTALLGKRPKATGRLTIRLSELEQAIAGATGHLGLAGALTIVLGRPPSHPARKRRHLDGRWSKLPDRIRDRLTSLGERREEVLAHITAVSQSPAMRRRCGNDLQRAGRLCDSLYHCIAGLPVNPPLPLPVFATQILGDSHALDRGKTLRHLLSRAIDEVFPAAAAHGNEALNNKPSLRETRVRQSFGRMGIVVDELSSTVLVLNLRPAGDDWLSHHLINAAEHGEPIRLTFRQLRQHALEFANDHDLVSVCENPSIVAAAADRIGPSCKPMVCIEGFPSHAFILLIRSLQSAGVPARYHGDFDRNGLRIANQMIADLGLQAWRMDTKNYATASGRSELEFEDDATVPDFAWAPSLASTLQKTRRILLEEMVLEELLSDLKT